MNNNSPVARRLGLVSAALVGCALVAGAAAPAMAAGPAPVKHESNVAVQGNGPVKTLQGRVSLAVHNSTNKTMHIKMDGKTITGVVEKDVAPGETLRAAGHTLASGEDVNGTIGYADGSKVSFWGYNPEIGYPSVGFGSGSNWERFSVDETHNFTESGHNFTVKRHADLDIGGGKDFHIFAK